MLFRVRMIENARIFIALAAIALIGVTLVCTTCLVQAAVPDTAVVVVVGASGEQEYGEQFSKWANDWKSLAEAQGWRHFAVGTNNLQRELVSNESSDSITKAPVAAAAKLSDLQQLENYFQLLAAESLSKNSPTQLWLVMIGHGTAAGKLAKFNLIGPDVSTLQLKGWLDKISCETVVIDCTSSSAPFLVELSSKNRIVVSATRSGAEINFARFGGYFAKALQDSAADLDHDHEVSLLEAFLKASKETEKFYRENSRLSTEHALLEDNADRAGTSANFYVGAVATATAAGGKAIDGKRAARIILWALPESVRLGPDQVAQRELLEREIDALRERKLTMNEAEYFDLLEKLMLKMHAIYDSERSATVDIAEPPRK